MPGLHTKQNLSEAMIINHPDYERCTLEDYQESIRIQERSESRLNKLPNQEYLLTGIKNNIFNMYRNKKNTQCLYVHSSGAVVTSVKDLKVLTQTPEFERTASGQRKMIVPGRTSAGDAKIAAGTALANVSKAGEISKHNLAVSAATSAASLAWSAEQDKDQRTPDDLLERTKVIVETTIKFLKKNWDNKLCYHGAANVDTIAVLGHCNITGQPLSHPKAEYSAWLKRQMMRIKSRKSLLPCTDDEINHLVRIGDVEFYIWNNANADPNPYVIHEVERGVQTYMLTSEKKTQALNTKIAAGISTRGMAHFVGLVNPDSIHLIIGDKSVQDLNSGSKLSGEQRTELGQQLLKEQERKLQVAFKETTIEKYVIEKFAEANVTMEEEYHFQKLPRVDHPKDLGAQWMLRVTDGEVTGGRRNWSEQDWIHIHGSRYAGHAQSVNIATGKYISFCRFIVPTILDLY